MLRVSIELTVVGGRSAPQLLRPRQQESAVTKGKRDGHCRPSTNRAYRRQ